MPVTTDDMTMGEVARRLTDLGSKMDTILEGYPKWADVQRVETGLKARHDADVAALTARVDSLASWQVWAGRTVLGAVILAALGAMFALSP